MYRVLLVTCALGLAAGFSLGPSNIVMRFVENKVMEDCFGKSVIEEWKLKMMTAYAKCSGDDISVDMIFQSLDKNRKQMQQSMFGPYIVGIPQQTLSRKKRQDYFTSEIVLAKRDEAISGMRNITCVMRELNLIQEDNAINTEYMKLIYGDIIKDEEFRNDMIEAIDMCNSFSMCMPLERLKSPDVKEHGRLLAFLKCEKNQKLMMCMKHNIRKELTETAVIENLSTEDEEPLMEEDDNIVNSALDVFLMGNDPILDFP